MTSTKSPQDVISVVKPTTTTVKTVSELLKNKKARTVIASTQSEISKTLKSAVAGSTTLQVNSADHIAANQLLQLQQQPVRLASSPQTMRLATVSQPVRLATTVQPVRLATSQQTTKTVLNVIPSSNQTGVSYMLSPGSQPFQNVIVPKSLQGNSPQIFVQTGTSTASKPITLVTAPAVQKSMGVTLVQGVGTVPTMLTPKQTILSPVNANIANATSLLAQKTKILPQFGGDPKFGRTQFLLQGVTQVQPSPSINKAFQVENKTLSDFQAVVSSSPLQVATQTPNFTVSVANTQGIATPITSPVVVPISSIASPQYNVLNIQTSLQNTESNPTMASPPPGLDHSYIGYTDINSDVTMSSSDHSYTGQNLNQKSTKMFVGDMGMKMNAADTDQSYGAIVSPNKVLQLVPQPMVPISQASKSITSPKRIMKKTVRKDKALGQVGASDVMKSVSSLTSSSDVWLILRELPHQ